MPIGDFVNNIPAPIFLLVHLAAFAIGAYFAWRSFNADASVLGWGFSLYALAEISYMTYHLDWSVFLFAHLISEVLDLVAFILIFVAVTQRALEPTNNASEQDLRPSVIHRQVTGGFRSQPGADVSAILTSLLTTARKRGDNLFHALRSVTGPSPLHAAGVPA